MGSRSPSAPGRPLRLQPIQRARYAEAVCIQYVRVDHRRADILVAEELLHGTNVRTAFEHMRGKGMAENVRRDWLGDLRPSRTAPNRLLDAGRRQMVKKNFAGPRIRR